MSEYLTVLPSLADIARWVASRDQRRWLREYTLEQTINLVNDYRDFTYVHQGAHDIEGVVCARSFEFGVVHIALIVCETDVATKQLILLLKELYPHTTHITINRRGAFRKLPISTVNKLLKRK